MKSQPGGTLNSTNNQTPSDTQVTEGLAQWLQAIPDELKGRDRWLLWKAVKRNGRITKVPYQACNSHKTASVANPRQWSSFNLAWKAYAKGEATGVGFVLGDGLAGIDLDKCRNPQTGGITQEARNIIDALDSYTEVSPSGYGVKIYVRASDIRSRKRTGLEVYGRGRFFAVTGDYLPGAPATLEDREVAVQSLLDRGFPDQWDGDACEGPSVLEGGRNNALMSMAGKLRRAGLQEQEILAALRPLNERRCVPPLGVSELRQIARSVCRYSTEGVAASVACDRVHPERTAECILSQLELIKASEVPAAKLEWLWHARLARGAITLVEGGPEKGKSTILVDLAARVSRGDPFPGEEKEREPGNVVMMIAEDDLATTVVPRLIAARADLNRIFFIGRTKNERGEGVPFHLSDDHERLRTKCRDVNALLIVVDPLVSFLGSRKGRVLNTNNDLEVRKSLGPLKDLAEELRASVAAIRHYRKGNGADAMEAGGGSVGFSALVRVIIAALPDPDAGDEDSYLLAVAKNNLIQKQGRAAYAYDIVPSADNPDIGCVRWGRTVDMSASDILLALAEANKDTSGKVEGARMFLEDKLASGEWVATTEIMKEARERLGLSGISVRRARAKLLIKPEKHGKAWFWKLDGPVDGPVTLEL